MKRSLIIFLVLIALLALPFLGGSAIWYLNGAHDLDVDGIAELVQRPETSIDVGAQWSHYGSDAGGHRFVNASQIDKSNVDQLVPRLDLSDRRLRQQTTRYAKSLY